MGFSNKNEIVENFYDVFDEVVSLQEVNYGNRIFQHLNRSRCPLGEVLIIVVRTEEFEAGEGVIAGVERN